MTHTADTLWIELRNAGLVTGDPPAPGPAASPWFVRLMLGVAGWIGALFLLGFVGAGLEFVFRSRSASLVAGLLCCAVALTIFKALKGNDLATQAALAVAIAGQLMFIRGLTDDAFQPSTSFFVEVAIFEAVLAWLGDNFVSRVLTAFGAALAMSYALLSTGILLSGILQAVAVAALWMNEGRWAARGAFWRAIGYGLTFALLDPVSQSLIGGLRLAPWAESFALQPWWPWLRVILMAGVLAYVATTELSRKGISRTSRTGQVLIAGCAIVALVTMRAGGVAPALVVLVIGFARGNRSLIGLGAFGVLGYLSYYYYWLQATLLVKSYALLGTGVTLLVFWAAAQWLFPARMIEEAPDA